MIKTKWNVEAVKAYETGQGVELVNEPYPHYVPSTTESEKQEHGEPVGWWNGEEGVVFAHDQICIPNWTDHYYIPLYTTPQTKEWLGLTADELNAISDRMRTWNSFQITDVYFAIEAKLRELNGYE